MCFFIIGSYKIIGSVDNDKERDTELILISSSHNYENPPALPIFDRLDGDKCKRTITSHYQKAVESYKTGFSNKQRLQKSFNDIKDKQDLYRINLVDNARFLRWTTHDWKESYKYVDYTNPVWTKEMRDTFGDEADLLLTNK